MKGKICSLTNADQDLNKAMNTLETLKSHNHELVEKYEKLQHDHSQLAQEYQVLLQLREQSLKTLKSSEMIQAESEEKIQLLRRQVTEVVDSMKILLKERETLIQLVDEKHRDVTILSSKIQSTSKW